MCHIVLFRSAKIRYSDKFKNKSDKLFQLFFTPQALDQQPFSVFQAKFSLLRVFTFLKNRLYKGRRQVCFISIHLAKGELKFYPTVIKIIIKKDAQETLEYYKMLGRRRSSTGKVGLPRS